MNDLEKSLAGDNDDLRRYFGEVSAMGFREDIKEMILKSESKYVKFLKRKLKDAIDSM